MLLIGHSKQFQKWEVWSISGWFLTPSAEAPQDSAAMSTSPHLPSAASPALLVGIWGEPCALEPFLHGTRTASVPLQDSTQLIDLPLPAITLIPKPWCPSYSHFFKKGAFYFKNRKIKKKSINIYLRSTSNSLCTQRPWWLAGALFFFAQSVAHLNISGDDSCSSS